MSEHILLSSDDDEEEDNYLHKFKTPVSNNFKRPRSLPHNPNSTNFCVIDIDDPTPPPKLQKSVSSTTSFVPETPFSDLSKLNDPPVIKCNTNLSVPSSGPALNSSGADDMRCLVSDDDAEGLGRKTYSTNKRLCEVFDVDSERSPECTVKEKQPENKKSVPDFVESWLDIDSTCCLHKVVDSNVDLVRQQLVSGNLKSTKTYDRTLMAVCTNQVQPVQNHDHDKENVRLEEEAALGKLKKGGKANAEKKQNKDEQAVNRKKSVEEKMRLAEEKKLKKEQDKLRKEALKAEAARLKQVEKERKKSEKYKFSELDIVADVHPKILQLGSIAGPLITAFSGKNLTYNITQNPFEKSIVWRMNFPEGMSQLSTAKADIYYVLLIYDDAEEFCSSVNEGSLIDHISSVRSHYPSYTICCLTNRLMSFINKREQQKYKNHKDARKWKRPPVEELFAKLTTDFTNVHSRQCADESEVADYIVGLTINLAKCYSRKKLTHLSVNANGCNVPKDCMDRKLIIKHPWLKALVSIPKVQPRFAIAIWKKYPTMKSLLRVYMDSTKPVHEKESLLKDLPVEGLLGDEQRRLGEICSKRVYRILMAQTGTINTDDAENGADFFPKQ